MPVTKVVSREQSAAELFDATGMTNQALAQALEMSERQIYNLRSGASPLRKVVRLALMQLAHNRWSKKKANNNE